MKLVKQNIAYILILVIVIVFGIYGAVNFGMSCYNNLMDIKTKKDEYTSQVNKLNELTAKAQSNNEKKENQSGKVIYEVLGQQFSAEASFGIMFENILSNITNSGVRIRSIDYNYQPSEDKVLMSGIPGYNACELSFVTVATYSQLQDFFKNITKEKYITSIQEIYIEPYDLDRTILIARFKIRIYTKTI